MSIPKSPLVMPALWNYEVPGAGFRVRVSEPYAYAMSGFKALEPRYGKPWTLVEFSFYESQVNDEGLYEPVEDGAYFKIQMELPGCMADFGIKED